MCIYLFIVHSEYTVNVNIPFILLSMYPLCTANAENFKIRFVGTFAFACLHLVRMGWEMLLRSRWRERAPVLHGVR